MYFPTESGRYYYSFNHGGVHLLLLDSGEHKLDAHPEYSRLVAFEPYIDEQTKWLERKLRSPAFRAARFRMCLLHIPPVVSPGRVHPGPMDPRQREPDAQRGRS
jgi:acid phosphatase type 7